MNEEDTIDVISQHIGLRHQVSFLTEDGEFIRSKYVTKKTPDTVNSLPLFDMRPMDKEMARTLWKTLNEKGYDTLDLQAEAIIEDFSR